MAKTLQQRFIVALKARGCEVVPNSSRKYVVLRLPVRVDGFPFREGATFYAGKSGSLRCGRNYTDSLPVSERTKRTLLDDRTPKVGDEFYYARVLNPDNTPMRYRITRIAKDIVYYRPVDGGNAECSTENDFPRWVGSWA